MREDKLGDCCLSLPILEAIRNESPDTRTTWICQPEYAPLFQGHPNVFEVWPYPRKPLFADQIRIARRIRKLKPDAVLLLRPNSRRWHQIAWMARVPQRIGVEYSGEKGYLTKNLFSEDWIATHEARKTLDMLSAFLDRPLPNYPARLTLPPEAKAAVDRLSLPPRFYVLQLGMGGSSQSFPPKHFAEVAEQISEEFQLEPVLTGAPSEVDLVKEFSAYYRGRFTDAVSKTSILELAEVVSRAQFALSVDTGTTHVGASVGVPSVVLMPKLEVSPDRWSPWMTSSVVVRPRDFCAACSSGVCHPGERTCVTSTTVEQTVEACRSLIANLP